MAKILQISKIILCSLFIIILNLCIKISCDCSNDSTCQNGGICVNSSCICPDGWQGSECQFCGSKVRLTDSSGSIHDGAGNYSIGIKCSWLIDARNHVQTNNFTNKSSIRLHLEEFVTECGWDNLYVYDGNSVKSPLLAVFSGIMYEKNYSTRRIPEVVAHSGSALLHFYSDDANTMSGFNLSYRVNGCPTINSNLICSDHGLCVDGTCLCDDNYKGDACHMQKCPNNCSNHLNQGKCDREAEICSCSFGFAGSDCTQLKTLGYWSTISPDFEPSGSASHGAAVWHDTLHIIGGESYGRGSLLKMYNFKDNIWEITPAEAHANSPEMRYGFSTVMYNDKIYIYGGVIENKGIFGELWSYELRTKNWENITVKTEPCHATNSMCGPLKATGHTATLVPEKGVKNLQHMVVIFGHSPLYGYLNIVQEFNFLTSEWKIVQTRGFPVKGGYGHSASYDSLTEQIYVYGGIGWEGEGINKLSSRLYSYEPITKTWTLLTSASTPRYHHTANFIGAGLMMVFGGSTDNSYETKCHSNELIVYDVLCDSWHTKYIPDDLRSDLARYGHSGVIFEKSLYIFGGFDGQMLSDMIKYTPGTCDNFTTLETCLNAMTGVKCIWKYDITKSKCIEVIDLSREQLFDQDNFEICANESRKTMREKRILKVKRCGELSGCQSCLSTSFGCRYCNGTCTKEKCDKNQYKAGISFKNLDRCTVDAGLFCLHLEGCHLCSSNSLCFWNYKESKCQALSNRSSYESSEALPCLPACSLLTSCGKCTTAECIWCQNEKRCVDIIAYKTSFPYGQCRQYNVETTQCHADMTGESNCRDYKTCAQCHDDPACGWCDDGSMTGRGNCLLGGDGGSQDEIHCPRHRWNFTSCPSCQCNGHSICLDSKICEQPCSNFTTGNNCEKCQTGYWGNPKNGGACQKCDCYGRATACHSETGKCFCNTKGHTGDRCEKCDQYNHYKYEGDVLKGACYYDLASDYKFTFNLSKKEDHHFRQINLRNSPPKSDIDTDFQIKCSVPAKINITIKVERDIEKPFLNDVDCTQILLKLRFSKDDYNFGIVDNVSLTTFYVYVYDLKPPLWLEISFSQYPKLVLPSYNSKLFTFVAYTALQLKKNAKCNSGFNNTSIGNKTCIQ